MITALFLRGEGVIIDSVITLIADNVISRGTRMVHLLATATGV